MKSRTVVGRTFAKVKHRITSIGSLVSISSDSPNPLLAPPDPIESPAAAELGPALTIAKFVTPPSNLDGAVPALESNTPSIAALSIKIESWTVFNAHPKYHATAYVKFDISCIAQSAGTPVHLDHPSTNNAGHLHSLKLGLSLTGPAITLSHYGNLSSPYLKPDEHWITLLHIGIKDTSLASKLSTSLRSIGRSAGRSAGRLGRYTNIDLINRWLHVLESDNDDGSGGREPVVVNATVNYKHSLLPDHTMCVDEVGCKVNMGKGERERAEMTVELAGQGTKRMGSDEEGDEMGSEDEEEERVREARVLGAPWL